MDSFLKACLCALLVLCVVVYKFKAKGRFTSLPVHSGHTPVVGSTVAAIKAIVFRKMSLCEFTYSEFKTNGWKSFTWSAVGGRVGVVLIEREDIKFLLKDSFNNFVKSPDFIENFSCLLGGGIFNSNGEVWKEQRVVMSQMFNRRQLRERMSVVFGTHAQDLVRTLDKHAASNKPLDIQPLFYCYTFDCINGIAFNKDVNSLEGNTRDAEFQQAFDVVQAGILTRFLLPWWRLNSLLGLPTEKGITTSMKIIDAYVEEAVDQYFEKDGTLKEDAIKDDRTMTGLFLDYARSSSMPYDRKFLRDMILNTVIAGRDTTGSALTSCIEYLSKHPEWQEQLHDEAMACFGGNTQEALTFDDVEGKSPVAEAVFLEALRLHPSVPVNGKISVKETTFPSGFKVPPGVKVEWLPYVTNRYEKLWGENPEDFNPKRWIGATYDEFMYPTFHAGPRLCLGKNMAILEGKIALLTLFAKFKFSPCEGFVPKLQPSITWQLDKNGLEVLVHSAK